MIFGLIVAALGIFYASYTMGRAVEASRIQRRVFDGWIDVKDLKR